MQVLHDFNNKNQSKMDYFNVLLLLFTKKQTNYADECIFWSIKTILITFVLIILWLNYKLLRSDCFLF